MKNISPRQRKILELLTQKGDLTIAEIRTAANISQATAYREIQTLIQAGLAQKTPGGLSLPQSSNDHCLHCNRPINPRLVFHIEQSNGIRRAACCPHCGLLALHHLNELRQAMTPDLLYGALLNAAQAWYVLGSDITPCCHPSALAFGSQTEAERFAIGFGGQVCNFPDAQALIQHLMSLHRAT